MAVFLELDAMRMLTAVLCAMCCALMGNWLVLRRQALAGDAISHAVLPGIVVAFLLSDSRTGWPVLIGAAGAGAVCIGVVELIRRFTPTEPGAAMGVVFSVMFAGGVLLMEQAASRHMDLDAGCVLYGQLSLVFWENAPLSLGEVFSSESLAGIPPQPRMLAVMLLVCVLFVGAFYKELRLSAFDPALALAMGFRPGAIHALATIFTAGAVVASFEAVGSIMVIAMLIAPPAAARLLTDRMRVQIPLSVALGATAAIAGDLIAAHAAALFPGVDSSLDPAGMIAVVAGLQVVLAALFGPRYGLVMRSVRRRRAAQDIAADDLVAAVYRLGERASGSDSVPIADVRKLLSGSADLAIRTAVSKGYAEQPTDRVRLTPLGSRRGAEVVRTHRVWEWWLVEELGLREDHVHETAEVLEHLAGKAPEPGNPPPTGAHGEPIPPPENPTGRAS